MSSSSSNEFIPRGVAIHMRRIESSNAVQSEASSSNATQSDASYYPSSREFLTSSVSSSSGPPTSRSSRSSYYLPSEVATDSSASYHPSGSRASSLAPSDSGSLFSISSSSSSDSSSSSSASSSSSSLSSEALDAALQEEQRAIGLKIRALQGQIVRVIELSFSYRFIIGLFVRCHLFVLFYIE